jgi:hypothetical protein
VKTFWHLVLLGLLLLPDPAAIAGMPAAGPSAGGASNVVFFIRNMPGGPTSQEVKVMLLNGQIITGKISKYYTGPVGSAPACGSDGNASFTLPAAWVTWYTGRRCPKPEYLDAGHIMPEPGKCTAIQLANLWACPLNGRGAHE